MCSQQLAWVLILLSCAASPLRAENLDEWPQRTQRDVKAVDGWVRGAYAGAMDASNRDFLLHWSQDVKIANERARGVVGVAGWRAVMQSLVNSTRDGHVYLQHQTPPQTLYWAGLALEQRDGALLARVPNITIDGVETRVPDAAELVSCDGEPAALVLERELDKVVADWRIPAQRAMFASQWFVNDGNPFRQFPKECRFLVDSVNVDILLNWTAVDKQELELALRPFLRVKRQMDQVKLEFHADGGAWITLGNLSNYAAWTSLIGEVREKRESVLSAPYLVWDLRGNGGGDSALGQQLASILWGHDTSHLRSKPSKPKRWRVSPLTIESMQRGRAEMAASNDGTPELLRMVDRLIERMEVALSEGAALIPDAEPVESEDTLLELPTSSRRVDTIKQPTYALTDGGCFSSCIMTVYLLRSLGVVQVGDPTGIHTVYGEVWFDRKLPSGLARLLLPVAISSYPEGELGGDAPQLSWLGASEDEAGLVQLIAQDANARRASAIKLEPTGLHR